MLEVFTSSKFNQDLKRCAKQGLDMSLLSDVVSTLRIPAPLPRKFRNHGLNGKLKAYHECHIAPDWVLVYRYIHGGIELYRTGTHAGIFGL